MGHERLKLFFIKETNIYYQKNQTRRPKATNVLHVLSALSQCPLVLHARDRHTVPRPGLIAGHHRRIVLARSQPWHKLTAIFANSLDFSYVVFINVVVFELITLPDETSTKRTMDPEGNACNSCNSWPFYIRRADQRACFGYMLQLLRALPSGLC